MKISYISIYILLFSLNIYAKWDKYRLENTEFKRPYIIISLGNSCKVALHINHFELNEYSYPLNWMIVPYSALYKFFNNDFKNFFNKENLVDHGVFAGKPNRNIVDKEYGILSVHDFPVENTFEAYVKDSQQVYSKIKEKFDRRITRLKRALTSGKFIYFIRTEITKNETQAFVQLINTKFPYLNYLFVAIGGTDEFKEEWHIPTVKNFYLKNYQTTFFHPETWKPIFIQLGLIHHTFSKENTLENLVNQLSAYM